jgi:multimeric flavodoxin WrbA
MENNCGVSAILDTLDASDVIVLASPVNCWSDAAPMNRFIERAFCHGYGAGTMP